MSSPQTPVRRFLPLVATLVAVGLWAGLVLIPQWWTWNPPEFLSPLFGVAAVLAVSWLIYSTLVSRRRRRDEDEDELQPVPLDPALLTEAAERESARAREYIEQIRDVHRREALHNELARLDENRSTSQGELEIVVFGTVSAGKTSLINTLLGREAGVTGAVMGTTRQGENHVYTLEGADGRLSLIDTPGIAEAGIGGGDREQEARRLAERADLLLFVVDHDLVRNEHGTLLQLARLGKRMIVVLNKQDLHPPADLIAIQEKLRERLRGVVPPEDVVTVAASPRAIPLREILADGSSQTVLDVPEPEVQSLRDRIAEVLSSESQLLRIANLLLKTQAIGREAETALDAERRRKCDELIEHYQWTTAATVFANPIPALNLVSGAAVQLDLIADLARVYGLNPSSPQIRALAGTLAQAMLKAGLTEAASSVIAGVFKRTPATFVAAGALQAVTMAYLGRIAGETLAEYFRNGERWGPEGVEGVVLRRFEANSRAEFLQAFARQGLDRFLSQTWRKVATPHSTEGGSR